jgi:hypothetical protein
MVVRVQADVDALKQRSTEVNFKIIANDDPTQMRVNDARFLGPRLDY